MEPDFNNLIKKFTIIDTHLHLGYLAGLNLIDNTEDTTISHLKKFNVKKAICAHHATLLTIEYGAEILLDILQKYKDFLYGYLVFNPNHSKKSLDIIIKNIFLKNILGIKIHPSWHFCYPGDEKYKKFWQFADENNLTVLTHSWNPNVANKSQKFSDPFLFEKILQTYPNIRLILGHAGGKGDYLYKVIDLVKKYKNLFVDFAGDIFVPGLIEDYVKKVGSERILFGTDMPWIDIRYHLINVLISKIKTTDKENIFSGNALRLFKALC